MFGGVTGSGTDFLVAAFQQAGSDLQKAVLQQGLLSDPIDKTVTFLVVFVLLRTLSAGGSSPGSRRVRRRSAWRERSTATSARAVPADGLDAADVALISRLVPPTPSPTTA